MRHILKCFVFERKLLTTQNDIAWQLAQAIKINCEFLLFWKHRYSQINFIFDTFSDRLDAILNHFPLTFSFLNWPSTSKPILTRIYSIDVSWNMKKWKKKKTFLGITDRHSIDLLEILKMFLINRSIFTGCALYDFSDEQLINCNWIAMHGFNHFFQLRATSKCKRSMRVNVGFPCTRNSKLFAK